MNQRKKKHLPHHQSQNQSLSQCLTHQLVNQLRMNLKKLKLITHHLLKCLLWKSHKRYQLIHLFLELLNHWWNCLKICKLRH